MTVLACVDRSAYAGSVCDHAAWLAGALASELDVLHVAEAVPAAGRRADERRSEALLRRARERLAEHGVQPRHLRLDHGDVASAALAADAAITVVGKRGERSAGRRDALGSNAAALLDRGAGGLCLVSHVYLPVRRALVLLDAQPSHMRTLEVVETHPALRVLTLDVVVVHGAARAPDAKLDAARARLASLDAGVFPLAAASPDTAAARRFEDRPADLIVMSREMLAGVSPQDGLPLPSRPIWAWRTPIFVC